MAMTVSIGRNIGDGLSTRPMDTDTWERFQREVQYTVEAAVGPVYFAGTGRGWSEEWGVEDAFTLVAEEPGYGDIRDRLLDDLARSGRYFGQDAIAVTIGNTVFV
jgi:hypothetical protein